MLVLRSFVLVLGVVGLAWTARAQTPIAFERATQVEAALPQSSVYEILEDRRGFLWFATREGLGRWDGTTMRTWRRAPFDRASLPGNIVRQLVEDDSGDLWVRTQATDWTPKGIARLLGPGHDEVRRYGHPGAEILIGPDGEAWLADSTQLWRFDRPRDAFVRVRTRLRPDPARMGLTTRDGAVWVASDAGLEVYPPRGSARTLPYDATWDGPRGNNAIFGALAEGPDGTLWVAGSRLGRLTPDRQRIETLPLPVPEIHSYGAGFGGGRLIPDRTGVWMASLNGVYRYETATGSLTRYSLRLPGDIETQNWVTGLHLDRAGTLWAGTVWGLHRATPGGHPFRLLAHDPDDPNTIGSGIVLSIHRDRRGSLWVGTLGGGLNRIAPDGAVTRYRHNPADPATLAHDWVWSLGSDDETLWIGTGDGLNALELDAPARIRRYPYDPSRITNIGPSAQGIHVDAEGTVWYGHIGGVHRRTRGGIERIIPIPAAVEAIRTAGSRAWITTAAGLYSYEASEDVFQSFRHDPTDPRSISDDATLANHMDTSGRLWVGTQSGLDRYDPDRGGFVHFSTRDGLPSDVVYAILEDDAGRLWISTNRGLARYDEDAAEPFRAYTFADGIGNVEFNRHAAWRDPDGTMYFGGDRGVTVFHPDSLIAPSRSLPVVVTDVHRSTRAGTNSTPYSGMGRVVLAPDVTTFGFTFAALAFTDAHLVRYAVRLDGWDDDWVEVGARREVTYTNLPPGSYTFHVRAASADGGWGEEATPVAIVVRPAWWQTVWFRLLVALGAIGLVAGLGWDVSRRRYRRQLARLEAQRALDAERARISRDMHDEVGASLSEIAVLSEVARRQLDADHGPNGATEDRLRRIADTSRAMLESLGHLVWAINPRNDTLPALIGTLREHAARFLEAHQLDGRLRFPRTIPERAVSAEVRRAVFLIEKEALHNIVKHAGARTVEIELTVKADTLTLVVSDDGSGFAPHTGDGAPGGFGGNGLANMERRAREAGGTLALDASASGTTVRVQVPLDVVERLSQRSPDDVTRRARETL